MWQLIAVLRLLGIVLWVLAGAVMALFIWSMSESAFRWIQRFWYQGLLWLMGVECHYEGEDISPSVLVVSNHISWADIIVIGARWPLTFLAKHEVASWPVVGWLAKRAGTLFIERGKGSSAATFQIAEKLSQGSQIGLFPEGGTSDGLSVKKFHPRIMQSAIDAAVPVQPVGICYVDAHRVEGAGSRISFVGAIGLVGSVWRTLCGPKIVANVRVFPPIPSCGDRQQLAQAAEEVISGYLGSTLNSLKSA